MKKIFTIIFALIFVSSLNESFASEKKILPAGEGTGRKAAVMEGKLMVRLHPGADLKDVGDKLQSVGMSLGKPFLTYEQSLGYRGYDLNKSSSKGIRYFMNVLAAEQKLLRTFYLYYDNDKEPEKAAKLLMKKYPEIEIAEPIYPPKLLATPNDPRIDDQNAELTQIRAYSAWDYTSGDTNIVIGISDNGVLQEHPDLTDDIAVNWDEIPQNGIDDDGNGYIDDYRGFNLAWEEEGGDYGYTFHYKDGHGTNVAGIAAASTNNSTGIAGISYNCRFFPLKASVIEKGDYIVYGYESIIYAAVNEFDVLSCSWGNDSGPFSDIEQSIIDYAISRGVAVVAAGGNGDGDIRPWYPAAYRGVLGVGEVYNDDRVTNGSSVGAAVRIMAPGEGNYTTSNSGNYRAVVGGTSFSAPVVAGVLGLVRAKYPELGPVQAQEFVRQTADDIADKNEFIADVVAPRVNAAKAVTTDPFSIPGVLPLDYALQNTEGITAERFAAGDTVDLTVIARNVLGNYDEIYFKLRMAEDFDQTVQILEDSVWQGELAAGESFDIAKFRFKVNKINYGLTFFRVDVYGRDDYHDFFLLPYTTGRDVTTLENDSLKFSVGDRGTIGFSGNNNNEQGIGIVYKGYENELFQSGFMATENSSKVVSSNWGSGQNFSDFVPVKFFIAPDSHIGIFTDADAATTRKIGIQVTEEFYLPDDGTPMAKNHVTVKNISGGPLVDVSAGYFFDWDIGDEPDINKTGLYTDVKPESQEGVAVGQYAAHRDESEFPFYGSAVYTEDENAVPQAAGLNYDITGGFSVSDQIDALNRGTSWQIGGIDDISYVVGMKFPGALPYEGIVEFDLCFGCGDELSHLAYNWRKCVRPDYITSVNKIVPENLEITISPNPASDIFSIRVLTPETGNMSVSIADIFGNEQYAQDITAPAGINTLNLSAGSFSSGIYFVSASIGGSSVSAKLVIVR